GPILHSTTDKLSAFRNQHLKPPTDIVSGLLPSHLINSDTCRVVASESATYPLVKFTPETDLRHCSESNANEGDDDAVCGLPSNGSRREQEALAGHHSDSIRRHQCYP